VSALREAERRGVLMKTSFFFGIIVGILLAAAGVFFYFAGGRAPVAASAPPIPFEQMLTSKALHARLSKEAPKAAPMEPTEANLQAGAKIYKQYCAVCHGLPGEAKNALAVGMFPPPPQMFDGKGVTGEPVGEAYWVTTNGIRLTGMAAFRDSLSDDQRWQVSLLLLKANELPPSVKVLLEARRSPAKN
jgi:mono/diheme cytochrome c family protein